MTDRAAIECGEFSYTRNWKTEIFSATNVTFKQEVRLPDLVVMVHTKDKYQYADHRAILDCGKVCSQNFGIIRLHDVVTDVISGDNTHSGSGGHGL